jgi:hypothetical protein
MDQIYFDAEQIEDPREDWRLSREAMAARRELREKQFTASHAHLLWRLEAASVKEALRLLKEGVQPPPKPVRQAEIS